jgi:hypothetical protein
VLCGPFRDFSNGFLAAEIFSRYFKGEIAMHSFDNGAATVKKKDNWDQLFKFFTRLGFPITQTLCDDVMNAKPDAAATLIGIVYSILTQKAAPTRPNSELIEASPAFARPTASQLVRDTLHSLGAALPVDLKEKANKAQSVVDQHNQQNRQDKLNDPSRFQTKRNTTKLARVPARSIGTTESEGPQIQFVKEVSVKRIDDNVAQLRASKAASAASARGLGSTSDFPVQNPAPAAQVPHAAGAPAAASTGSSKPVLALLSAGVLVALDGAPQLQEMLDPRSDGAVAFVDVCSQMPDQACAQVFQALTERCAAQCADSCLASPKEFWTFFSLMLQAITRLHHSSTAFDAACLLIGTVGEKMVAKDAYVPFALFADFALPKVAQLCSQQARKLGRLAPLFYAYCAPDADEHVKVLRRVQEEINSVPVFVQCLVALVQLEREFTEKLLDMYHYYGVLGTRAAQPQLRAAALSVLAALPAHDHEQRYIIDSLDRMGELMDDQWWEVKAQLLCAAAALLHVVGEEHPRCGDVYILIERVLSADVSVNVAKIGLSALASVLSSHPQLLRHYVAQLLTHHDARQSLLNQHHHFLLAHPEVTDRVPQPDEALAVQIPSSCQSAYRLPPVNSQWYGLGIAQTIVQHVREAGLGNIGAERVELLAASVANVTAFPSNEVEHWRAVFVDLKEFILVELCDEKVCDLVVNLLKKFLFDPNLSNDAMQIMTPTPQGTVPPLFGILKFVFPVGAPESCERAVFGLLDDLSRHPPFLQHVYSLIKNFADKEAAVYNASRLPQLMRQIEVMSRK